MLEDFENFYLFYKYDSKQEEKISKEDSIYSDMIYRRFDSNANPGIIILSNGTIYEFNTEFYNSFHDQANGQNLKQLIGLNILQLLSKEYERWNSFSRDRVRRSVESVLEIEQDNYILQFNGKEYSICVIKKENHKLMRGFNNLMNEQKVSQEYFKYKKCLMDTYLIYFELL
eukprot:Mrub_10374.p1 GENE.Mrub_10374~~Mrub_10374.p1  ORF type:complete len:195 (+),score=14.00 Mrub_10374:70-585(+)